jgi:MazG family protein
MQEKTLKNPSIEDLMELVRRLRGPEGCPWDREQTLGDLKQYLLEECYEVMDAIDGSRFDQLREELGDLLFHIVFLASLAEEKGAFTLSDVIHDIHGKMVRRHPHVFGDAKADDPETVRQNWWEIKRKEASSTSSLLDSVPRHLPALQRAYRLGQRATRAGMDWPGPEPVLDKIREEIAEMEIALAGEDAQATGEELGDLLFSLANLARHLKKNPEESLQRSNDKFLDRFRRMESRARDAGIPLDSLSPSERDRWWEEGKREPAG